jgi:hypothetical protein
VISGLRERMWERDVSEGSYKWEWEHFCNENTLYTDRVNARTLLGIVCYSFARSYTGRWGEAGKESRISLGIISYNNVCECTIISKLMFNCKDMMV